MTLFLISIRYGIQSVSELEPLLGLCCIYNLVVELQQEAPYCFSAQLKADFDYRVTWVIKNKPRGGTCWCNLPEYEEDALKTWFFLRVVDCCGEALI